MATLFVDKLDPQSGTALEIGSSGDTVTIPSGATITNSGTATGFGGGKVLQVVQGLLTTEQSTTSTSYVAPGLDVTITPAATSSKILIMMCGGMYGNPSSGFNYVPTIYRDSTNLADTDASGFASFRAGGSTLGASVCINYLDSPSSTSAITYHYYHKISTGTAYIGYNSNATSTIIAMEIGA
jgi:hypothetical protein